MNAEQLAAKVKSVAEEWPLNSLVWHRADGRRGVVAGYSVHQDGEVTLRVDYGAGGWSNDRTGSLSAVKIGDGTDGEDWKDGEEGAKR